MADVDGDGQREVLWGGFHLMSVDGSTGALEWTYPTTGDNGRLWPSPAIADLDRNGSLEVVIGSGNGRVVSLGGNGLPRAGFPALPFASGEVRSLGVADVDGDGDHEILVARAAGTAVNQWSVLEHTGAVRSGWPQHTPSSPGFGFGAYNQNLAAGDLDGDGRREIVATSDVHFLATFSDGGVERKANPIFGGTPAKDWSQVGVQFDQSWDLLGFVDCFSPSAPTWRSNFAFSAPVVADLDRNGTPEIIVIGDFYDACTGTFDLLFQQPIVLNADRTRWTSGVFDWTVLPDPTGSRAPLSLDFNVVESLMANPAIVDLDGDGKAEIVFPSWDGKVHAYQLGTTEAPGWPISLNLPGAGVIRFASEVAAADLDRDGRLEVLFHVWTQKGSNQEGELRIVGYDGSPLASIALPRGSAADTWGGALGAPTLANIDGDPALEVLSGTVNAGLVAYELPGTSGAGFAWPTSRGDFTRAAPEPERLPIEIAVLSSAFLGGRVRRRRA